MRGRRSNFSLKKARSNQKGGGGGVGVKWICEKGGAKNRIYDISMKHSFEGYSFTC